MAHAFLEPVMCVIACTVLYSPSRLGVDIWNPSPSSPCNFSRQCRDVKMPGSESGPRGRSFLGPSHVQFVHTSHGLTARTAALHTCSMQHLHWQHCKIMHTDHTDCLRLSIGRMFCLCLLRRKGLYYCCKSAAADLCQPE